MWESDEVLRAELSAVDISWYVVARAERAADADEGYIWVGVVMAAILAIMTPALRFLQVGSFSSGLSNLIE